TLTVGRPTLESINPVAWSNRQELLAIGAALEGESTHPIAAAIRAGAEREGVKPMALLSVTHTTGRGMSGVMATPSGEVGVCLGSFKHVEEIVPACLRSRTQEELTAIQREGRIGVVVARAQAPGDPPDRAGEAAVLVLADVVRPGAVDLVRELHAIGVRPVRMLTGDNRSTAQRVAQSTGLDQFDAELLPEDKLRIVGEMKAEVASRPRRRGLLARLRPAPGVAVIGDGVNDAPALAASDVSIAIGSIGSAAALESADIVLMSDNLSTVPWAVRFARRARTVVTINLLIAVGVIALMSIATLVASMLGRPIPMAIGVLAHEGGTLLVVLNSLILLTAKGPSISLPARALAPPGN
ncbi:MAG: HAD family hydrolase, partial [Planctomycetota bacterium]